MRADAAPSTRGRQLPPSELLKHVRMGPASCIVLIVPQRVNADDVLFAPVRARYLDSPEDVASDLQHAADYPERLDGVTPYQALAEAGELLTVAGLHDEAVNVLRRAVAAARGSHDSAARISLAAALARARGTEEAEGPFRDTAPGQGPPGSIGARLEAARAFRQDGQREQARRWAGAPAEHAPHSALGHRLAKLAHERMRETSEATHGQARAGTWQGSGPPGGQVPSHRPGAGGAGPYLFPARAGDAVLWWPEAQYQRLMRQLPELAPALGWPWAQHLTNTENVLRSIGGAGQGTGWLMPADFGQFAGYLKQTATDPRAAEALRGYAAHAVVTGTPTPWPPRSRKPCWCGSDRRYQDCCGAV